MSIRGWINKGVCAALLGLVLSGCETAYAPPSPAFHAVLQQPYHLDSGDRVRITVFGQDDLTNTYAVDKSGYIAFPLVGAIAARGHTLKAVEREIAQKLGADYIRDPDVSVEVNRYRPFFVLGEVNQPGQYVYVPGMTAQNAIASAGGYSARANQQAVDITRNINGDVLTGRVPITDPILAGDTIYIRERTF